jgi:hypothetical protein
VIVCVHGDRDNFRRLGKTIDLNGRNCYECRNFVRLANDGCGVRIICHVVKGMQ